MLKFKSNNFIYNPIKYNKLQKLTYRIFYLVVLKLLLNRQIKINASISKHSNITKEKYFSPDIN